MKRIAILTLVFIQSICAIAQTPQKLCRKELSVFFAGITGLGAAWGRAANEPSSMNPGAVIDIQDVLGNARDALNMVRCIPFDIEKLNRLISKLPSLTNAQAVEEIEALIKDLEIIIASVHLDCGNSATLLSLYVTAVHLGAAQAWASSRICQPAPMPANIQTVIRNHLNTARNAFAVFLPCVPGVSLNQFSAIPVSSMNSLAPHTQIVGLHTNLLWNISLSECCCNCADNNTAESTPGGIAGKWSASIGYKYEITQTGSTFSWRVTNDAVYNETANGKFLEGNRITATWTNKNGTDTKQATVIVENGRAIRINWDNGVTFRREN